MARFTDLTTFPLYYEDGFDQFGYDRDGFDRKGFNQEGFDRDGNLNEVVRDKKERQAYTRSWWTGTTAWKDARSLLYGFILYGTVWFVFMMQILRTGVSENHVSAAFFMLAALILILRKHTRLSPHKGWIRPIGYVVVLAVWYWWAGAIWGY